MKKLDVKSIRGYQLEMLEYIDKVCNQHGIEYSLFGGTMLGAVRHNGYIPWDDDVDIILQYDEYVKLLDVCKKENAYHLLTPQSKNYAFFYSKLIHPNTTSISHDGYKHNDVSGVFIDIFPLVPSNRKNFEKYWLEMINKCWLISNEEGYFSFVKTSGYGKTLIRMPYVFTCKALGSSFWSTKMKMFIEKHYKTCEFYGFAPWKHRKNMPRALFSGTKRVMFENLYLPIYANYDSILRLQYGDYMKLPPEKDRHFPHSSEEMFEV